jgi:tRNA-dihydrouridine synthase B
MTAQPAPLVSLAPMAGITDLPYRKLVQSFGAGRVTSEMVASQEMVQAKAFMREKAELGADVENTAVQLAGREAYWMGEAARLAESMGAQIIDINMGCPAKRVTGGLSGSALMREPEHALTLIEAVVQAVKVPVTLKMRLGWDDTQRNAADLAKRAENAGIQMITVHGRTRCQFYDGAADWAAIKAVKQAVKVPVLANGDIVSASSAKQALVASGADGVMIGRGARGKPWILAQINASHTAQLVRKAPTGHHLSDMVAAHYQDMLSFYGLELGLRCARKHLGWFIENVLCDVGLRQTILTAKDPALVMQLIPEVFVNSESLAA